MCIDSTDENGGGLDPEEDEAVNGWDSGGHGRSGNGCRGSGCCWHCTCVCVRVCTCMLGGDTTTTEDKAGFCGDGGGANDGVGRAVKESEGE